MLEAENYPSHPEPLRVEIEPTNICNAKCDFCPRWNMGRKQGYLDVENLVEFLDRLEEYRDGMWLNQHSENHHRFPRLVFAGIGEPTLHPRIVDIVREGSSRDFETEVVTNGSRLSADLAKQLATAGLTNLAISLHSLDPEIHYALMKLRLEDILPRVKETLKVLDDTDVGVELWRVSSADGSSQSKKSEDERRYKEFLSEYRKKIVVLGPTPAWNRGGQLPHQYWNKVHDTNEVWCEKLYFTLNVAYDGTALMCCCDYSQITAPLGNAWEESIETLQKRREKKFEAPLTEDICKACRRPPDATYRDSVKPTLISLSAVDYRNR